MSEASEISLRRAVAADVGPVTDLVRRAFAIYTPLIGRPPAPALYDYGPLIATGRVWLAEGGALLGMIYTYPEGDGAVMLDVLAVDAAAQGRGIAKRLISAAETQARANGAPLMRVYTNAVMQAPQVLYPRLGYVETHRGKSDGYDRIHYEKLLS